MYYIGIMSGTSLDGVDAVLVNFSGSSFSLIDTCYVPYDPFLQAELLGLNQSGENELHRAALSGNRLSRLYAETVVCLLEKAKVDSGGIVAIGCHGQTIRHCPQLEYMYSIQLVNGALLAELTDITVVTDFRNRDIAANGQGAPLVPAFHQQMFSHSDVHRLIINIGGIANITSLPVENSVSGFDCGPGNMLMDAWCLQHTGERYDQNGLWAKSGKVIDHLLNDLLSFPYFSMPPPKSTGRETFDLNWLLSYLTGKEAAQDVQSTLLQLTVQTIADSIRSCYPTARELYLCGGGAHNETLVARLQQELPDREIRKTDVLGIDADWVEACAFAWLARQSIERTPGNLPAVTGATGRRVLGAIYPA
ncbi:anhydro-N-acetylmuramic acid kinase [Nitrosomonas eutropha]|uniref:anhydro-N-acetylmuramic acid kinase n=1 Tax=Nitrosomonas TaxID=914 RepID=UPI00087F9F14|nr:MULTISPECIES: anhydro-N-acetylmuramic acid kinase [Nitrosomonas]MXS80284.1 anhydro-N-acetylmuramic acid kinase [Nitrosomonas sp. GH22]SCX00192.1 anhydro-N-acetylmuramic acid kinase [Nitrosomonas eutropha]SDW32067.1 anhydro-N-acetylmuramic acid kinase [Nitrosomonas eutropha]